MTTALSNTTPAPIAPTAPHGDPFVPPPLRPVTSHSPRPRIIATLYDNDGIHAAWSRAESFVDTLLRRAAAAPARAGLAIQLHTTEPGRVAREISSRYPGVPLVVGVGVDWIARKVAAGEQDVTWAARQFLELARRAVEAGAIAIMWNAEASWKTAPNTVQRARIIAAVRAGLALVAQTYPALAQWHTSFDHPGYHSTYPWEAWLGAGSPIVASFPQVYAAPGGTAMAHRGALPAREARALASWAAAVRAGWIRPDDASDNVVVQDGVVTAPADNPKDIDWHPYYQLHNVTTADTVASAVGHPTSSFWALQGTSDAAGRAALSAAVELSARGFWGEGAVARFQASVGLTADDVCGPVTLRALGVAV